MDINEVFDAKIRKDIFKLAISNPNLSIQQLADKLKQKQPAISRAIKGLKEAKIVKIRLVESSKKGVKKLISPSMQGFLEPFLNVADMQLSKEKWDIIDDFYFTTEAKNLILKSVDVKGKSISESMGIGMLMVFPQIPKFAKDRNTQRKYNKVLQILKPFTKKLFRGWKI